MYGWMMEKHQPVGIGYQPIRDDYIEDSMTQYYMEFDENCRGKLRFWDHTFSQAEFDKYGIVHGSIDWNSGTSSFEEGGSDVGSQGRAR